MTAPDDTVSEVTPRSFSIGDTTVAVAGGEHRYLQPVSGVRPNPVRRGVKLQVRCPAGAGPAARLYDRAGRERIAIELDRGGAGWFDTQDLAPGVYLVRVEGRRGTAKVVVLR